MGCWSLFRLPMTTILLLRPDAPHLNLPHLNPFPDEPQVGPGAIEVHRHRVLLLVNSRSG